MKVFKPPCGSKGRPSLSVLRSIQKKAARALLTAKTGLQCPRETALNMGGKMFRPGKNPNDAKQGRHRGLSA